MEIRMKINRKLIYTFYKVYYLQVRNDNTRLRKEA
jgi:hypothetical protein